ncbi:MAG: GDYXXLXY domain-containing protein [Pseudomonadota bacterium]|nr:GDYXXLXY domain-containing protein [Pseudomonadota bacterium]
MTPFARGLLVGAIQVLLVAGIGAKFLVERSSYPRLWVETAPYDPDMPIRGRYVNIALLVDADRNAPNAGRDRAPNMFLARLEARGDRLVAVQDDDNGTHWVRSGTCGGEACWQLAEPLAYFIPEHATDPSRQPEGSTLWAEVTLPPKGAPRPIRLGAKQGESIEPIAP